MPTNEELHAAIDEHNDRQIRNETLAEHLKATFPVETVDEPETAGEPDPETDETEDSDETEEPAE